MLHSQAFISFFSACANFVISVVARFLKIVGVPLREASVPLREASVPVG